MKSTLVRFSTILLALSCGWSAATFAQDNVTTDDVTKAIQAGIQYLRSQQQPDGSWPYMQQWTPGATALAVLALVHVGVDPNDPAIQKGTEYILAQPFQQTYVVSLTAMALAAVNPERYKAKIQEAANWLLSAQCGNGQWTYFKVNAPAMVMGRQVAVRVSVAGDNSNTQFAVLALYEAARAGASVPRERWQKINQFYRACQTAEGGWGYTARGRDLPYGSMTAAGICGLVISSTASSSGAHRCGYEKVDKDVEKGLQWLADKFSVDTNPDSRGHYYYYMYALERVGVLTGERLIGGHDWYREGAARLVQRQGPDGSWNRETPDTCFALLFFGKGGAPLAMHKLKWGQGAEWNNDPHDAEHLTKYYTSVTKIPVSWETVDTSAPLTEWLRAPVLYITGHTAPSFSDEEIARLRNFIDQGGFLFAEACCGRGEFDKGFRAIAKRICPDSEMFRLEADHPLYQVRFAIDPKTADLWGINTGCRVSIIYSPKDLSCTWEMAKWGAPEFKLGVNILAYATGEEPLRQKLDRVVIAEKGEEPKPPPRGALVIAQVRHGSDWNTDPLSLNKLMLHLRERAGFDVGSRRKVLMLSDPELFDYPVLYITSHAALSLSQEEIERLRTYLTRGGFLFSDACCGSKTYDASFRALVKELFPQNPLEPLPASHPIYSIAGKVDRVQYKPRVLAEEPGKDKPELEGVTLTGRTVLVYSRYDMTCSIHGHPCPMCRGIVADDAYRLATGIVLYAMAF